MSIGELLGSAPLLAAVLLVYALTRLRARTVHKSLRVATSAVWLVLTGVGVFVATQALAAPPPQATNPGTPCLSTAPKKTFAVSLINIPIFLNRFGDVVPEGRMYILNENIATVRANFRNAANPFQQNDLIEPLVLRANRGDCVEIAFTNRLNEPAPAINRDAAIFKLPGEVIRPAGTITPNPREFAPARTQPDIDFNPALAPRASIHFTGLDYDVKGSDGTAAGNNPNSTIPAGGTITYRLLADQEGQWNFQDGADLTSHVADTGNFIGSNGFGAFGGILVEKPGTTWVDSSTGAAIKSGISAIIKDPNGPDFREHALFMHDEVEAEPGILTRFCIPPKSPPPADGNECVNPTAAELAKLRAGTLPALGGGDADALINGEVPVKLEWFAFNYRAEPGFNREEVDCPALAQAAGSFQAPACVGEETSLSSWPFGDPGGGDLVIHNYRGEPMELRLFHSAEQETHTFHWHVNRWPFDPKDEGGIGPISNRNFHTKVTNPLDVQAVSPASSYELIPEGGAGSAHDGTNASFGDVIFHCHLYPHFANGMWGLNRTLDKLEDGTRKNPDTTPIPKLIPLVDFDYQPSVAGTNPPPTPTAARPGFPFFVPGKFGFKGPKPPLGVPSRLATGTFPPLQIERDAADAGAQVPGAFFRNTCPAGRPLKTFNVAAIQLPLKYNDDLNWNNPQGRIYVLQSDKAAILAGQKPAEPFSPLLNVGDCVVYNLRNDLPINFGGTVFDRLQETNEVSIHQHLVQFDVLTSDGAANGWNYDQGADAAEVAGPDNTITSRNFVQDDIRTNSFHDHLFPNVHQDSGLFGGGTVHPPGCTFHDPVTGNPVTVGTLVDVRCNPTVDYHGDDTDGQDFRNYSLFVEDHVPQFQPANPGTPNDDQFVTPQGVPIFPAKFPSSPDDQGVMGVNYRLEPFESRRSDDPSKLFDSKRWGDPFTPQLRAYAGDEVRFKLFDLSMEESHAFNIHRWRWAVEPDDPQSNVVQAQHLGMLEYFEARIRSDNEDPNALGLELRDYLYSYGGADDWFLGAWGLFRVAGCNPDNLPIFEQSGIPPLKELPDNPVADCPDPAGQTFQRTVGDPCPMDGTGTITVPVKRFTVVSFNKDIVFNGNGEHDPNGVMYALEADVAAIKAGTKPAEPLVLRVNKGDCIEVTLKNQLEPAKMKPHCFEAIEPGQLATTAALTFPECIDEPPNNEVNVPGFQPFPVSARASLHPNLVNYHIGSDGANVGFNFDSTVAPGGQILYRWFAADELGLGVLEDRADVQNHLHHGMYGGLIIEPEGATFRNATNGATLPSGGQAVIVDPNGPDFRENIVFMESDLALFQANGQPVLDNRGLDAEGQNEADDPEDQGEFSIGYRNEPLQPRIAANPDVSLMFASGVHGDPDTPLFKAYPGDRVKFRVSQVAGDPRSTGFALHGHRWRRSPDDPQSQLAAFQGQFNPAVKYEIDLNPAVAGGAGGPHGYTGDYLYRSNTLIRHLPGGQWGIFRVFGTLQSNVFQLPDHPL